MRVPYAKGFWPTFWMLGANVQDVRWPACGEIDIMEVFGHRRGRMSCSTVHNPMHSWGTKDPLDGGCVDLGTDGQPAFHTWKLLWTPDAIAFYFDDDEETPIWVYERPGNSRGTALDTDTFPYTLPEYFILNLAVGGNGPAEEYDAAALARGVHLEVDYVRVYELSSASLPTQVAEDATHAAEEHAEGWGSVQEARDQCNKGRYEDGHGEGQPRAAAQQSAQRWQQHTLRLPL